MDDVTRFARSSNAFGLSLYRRLPGARVNLVFSPASITTALAMTWAGARGATAEQMQQALCLTGTPESVLRASAQLAASLTKSAGPAVLRMANGLFAEASYAFENEFLTATEQAHGASLERLDFRGAPENARGIINGWVEARTEKRIKDLVPPGGITTDERLVLVNAVYFLGDWQEPFEEEATEPAPFHTSVTDTKDVPTMHQMDELRFAARDGLKALELPYRRSSLSMLLVLPDARDGLPALEAALTSERLDALVHSLDPTLVRVALPRFEMDPAGSIPLRAILGAMGMSAAFDPQQADFTAIANPTDHRDRLYLSEVFHKAFVKADERGTEAAAATAALYVRLSAFDVEFTADHPFLFFIRDNPTGLVLFMGRVADPSVK